MTETPPSEPKKMSRREMLAWLTGTGVSVAGIGLGLRPRDETDHLPAETTPETSPSHPDTPEVLREESMYRDRGVEIWQDQHGIPTRLKDAGGNRIDFDQDKLQEANQKALEENSGLTVVELIQVETNDPSPTELGEAITEPPEDILSKEQLALRGIEIIGAEGINLHLRPSAFEPGALLEHFQEGSGNELVVIITDEPVLSAASLADTRYDAYRQVIDDHFNFDYIIDAAEARERKVHRLTQSLEKMRLKQRTSDIRNLEIRLALINNTSDDEIQKLGLNQGNLKGYALPPEAPRPHPDKSIIFLAITPEATETNHYAQITTAAQENYFSASIEDWNIYDVFDTTQPYTLKPSDSYPRPENYPDNPNPGVMTGGAFSPDSRNVSLLLHHELAHINLSLNGQDSEDEMATDARAMASITRAAEKADHSGYFFVLENKINGTYVVT